MTDTMPERTLAIGAHIGDMDLAAGPYLAQSVLDGGEGLILALTPGERGHPRMSVADYKVQKIAEGAALAAAIGVGFEVFDDLSDGMLVPGEQLAARVARVIRRYRPTTVLAHWKHSIHSDHEVASWAAERGRFLAGLPGWETSDDPDQARHSARLLYTDNWEDAEGYDYDTVALIGDEAYDRWLAGISTQAFARGETYGFRYIDFYSAQMITRGCLSSLPRAVAFSSGAAKRVTHLH